jgi:hypothetical protein
MGGVGRYFGEAALKGSNAVVDSSYGRAQNSAAFFVGRYFG